MVNTADPIFLILKLLFPIVRIIKSVFSLSYFLGKIMSLSKLILLGTDALHSCISVCTLLKSNRPHALQMFFYRLPQEFLQLCSNVKMWSSLSRGRLFSFGKSFGLWEQFMARSSPAFVICDKRCAKTGVPVSFSGFCVFN